MDKNFGEAGYNGSGIYKIVNKVNGKIYVGQTNKFGRRAAKHLFELQRKTHKNIHLQNAWNAYGSEAFVFEILEVVENPEERNEAEQKWIDMFYGENCYNMIKSVKMITEIFKQKLSELHTGRTFTEEHKQKLSAAKLGKPLSEYHKQRIKEGSIVSGKNPGRPGVPKTEEHKKKIQQSMLKRKQKNKTAD